MPRACGFDSHLLHKNKILTGVIMNNTIINYGAVGRALSLRDSNWTASTIEPPQRCEHKDCRPRKIVYVGTKPLGDRLFVVSRVWTHRYTLQDLRGWWYCNSNEILCPSDFWPFRSTHNEDFSHVAEVYNSLIHTDACPCGCMAR